MLCRITFSLVNNCVSVHICWCDYGFDGKACFKSFKCYVTSQCLLITLLVWWRSSVSVVSTSVSCQAPPRPVYSASIASLRVVGTYCLTWCLMCLWLMAIPLLYGFLPHTPSIPHCAYSTLLTQAFIPCCTSILQENDVGFTLLLTFRVIPCIFFLSSSAAMPVGIVGMAAWWS